METDDPESSILHVEGEELKDPLTEDDQSIYKVKEEVPSPGENENGFDNSFEVKEELFESLCMESDSALTESTDCNDQVDTNKPPEVKVRNEDGRTIATCPECDKVISQKINPARSTSNILTKHFTSTHKRNCPICYKRFSSIPRVKEHVNGMHSYPCPTCRRIWPKQIDLELHIWKAHMEIRKKPSTTKRKGYVNEEVNPVKFPCAQCGNSFNGWTAYKVHFNAEHKTDSKDRNWSRVSQDETSDAGNRDLMSTDDDANRAAVRKEFALHFKAIDEKIAEHKAVEAKWQYEEARYFARKKELDEMKAKQCTIDEMSSINEAKAIEHRENGRKERAQRRRTAEHEVNKVLEKLEKEQGRQRMVVAGARHKKRSQSRSRVFMKQPRPTQAKEPNPRPSVQARGKTGFPDCPQCGNYGYNVKSLQYHLDVCKKSLAKGAPPTLNFNTSEQSEVADETSVPRLLL